MTSTRFTHRIPQEIIDDLISRHDIVEVVGRHLKLRREGKDYLALCPFHRENTPSFSVSPDKQFYYCFGCGASGNAMVFLENYSSQSFLSIIMDMASDHAVDLSPYLKTAMDADNDLSIVPAMQEAADYFASALSDQPDTSTVRQYLTKRGVPTETTDTFMLGYAGYGQQIVDDLKENEKSLILSGIFGDKEGRIYSSFRNRLVMPLRDPRGKVIALTGRTLVDEKPKYLNTKETALFSRNSVLYGLYESIQLSGKTVMDHLYVVEGQFDVIGCHMLSEPAVAGLGSSISVHQLRLLLRHGKKITFLFDGDKAGHKAAIQVCSLLMEHLTDMDASFDVIILRDGNDPFSLASEGETAFRAATAEPTPWMEALFSLLAEQADLKTPQGKSRYAADIIEIIHEARDPLIRHMALSKLEENTSIPMQTLSDRMETLPLSQSGQAMKVTLSNEATIRFARIIWDEPSWSDAIPDPDILANSDDELTMTLGVWIREMRKGNYDAQINDKEQALLSASPDNEKAVITSRRNRGSAMALGRMLSNLPPEIMQSIMQEAPEENQSQANSLGWHITGQCAAKLMQEITRKSAIGIMNDEDRAQFINLRQLRQQAVARSRALS